MGNATLSPLKRAYLALEQLEAKLARELAGAEPVAIIGIGCRFPRSANDPDSFWRSLQQGVDAIGEVPSHRVHGSALGAADAHVRATEFPTAGGFLNDVDYFEPEFFGISPREATSLDPQQRLLLEVSWEALERAGQIQNRLADNDTGVFIGITSHDYAQLLGASGSAADFDAYRITGNSLNAAAGRLSYAFGFQGPSIAVDTACSSSLVAVHLACRSLLSRECSLALAGGVNLILSPVASIALARARVLSPDGRCKGFDAAADGMGRGEGCGVVVLKRLSDAVNDRNEIVALIMGSAVNQDGPSSGLTVPNRPAQEALLRRALRNARLQSEDIDYIEAHGTGTSLGDPVEFGALATVFGAARPPDRPLHIGSVKSNIGHSEAAAGIAGLIKTALSLSHSEIPPHLHFTRPSPHIQWSGTSIRVPTSALSWPEKTGRKAAGVSSFGFTGTNAHVILQEAPTRQGENQCTVPARPAQLLTLSARSWDALKELAARFDAYLSQSGSARLDDICYTASTARSHFEHRLAIQARSVSEMQDALRAFRVDPTTIRTGHSDSTSRLAWIFGDQGRRSFAIDAATSETEPVFKESLERCRALLAPHLDASHADVLAIRSTAPPDAAHRHASLFALQYAFAKLWRSWGVSPSILIGDGVGEYVTAVLADILSLEDALELLLTRSRLLERAKATPPRAESDYSSDSEDGVEAFRSIANRVRFNAPTIRVASRTGQAQMPPGEHWVKEFCRAAGSVVHGQAWTIPDNHLVLEVGPVSLGFACSTTSFRGVTADGAVSSQLLDTLGDLYVRGADINWPSFWGGRPGRHVVLPTYPFARQRYWVSPARQPERSPAPVSQWRHPLLGDQLQLAATNERRFESRIRADAPTFLQDHRVFGETVLPASAYLELAFATIGGPNGSDAIGLRDVIFHRPLVLSQDSDTVLQTLLTPEAANEHRFEIYSRGTSAAGDKAAEWLLHCSGLLTCPMDAATGTQPSLASLKETLKEIVTPERLYEQCRRRGVEFGPRFRGLAHIARRDGEALGHIELPPPMSDADDFYFHPALLDGCLQVLGAAGRESGRDAVYLPLTLGRFHLLRAAATRLWSYARLHPVSGSDPSHLTVDFKVFAEDGRLVATLEDLELQRTSAAALPPADRIRHDWLYLIQWDEQPRPQPLHHAERVALMNAVSATLQQTRPASLPDADQSTYLSVIREMETLSTQYAVQALRQLGCGFAAGEYLTVPKLACDLGIRDRYCRQLNRFLEMFVEDGWLEMNHEGWRVSAPPPGFDADLRATQLKSHFPAAQHELQMIQRCGSRLAAVFRGDCDPLELLFPAGETVTAASLYQDAPGARAANALIERLFKVYLQSLPRGRRVRILEVGAGTGGTTASLLPHLPATGNVEYLFTDVSAAFLNRARERFSALPFVEYRTFDVETPPSEQGFSAGSFDIVLAGNVLHATRDLRESLGHVRDLLLPAGMLVLLEGTAPLRFIDLIFGLTDGWWRFSDVAVRRTHPLVSTTTWKDMLHQLDFEQTSVVTPEGQPGFFAHQAVILSLKHQVISERSEQWIVFSDGGEVGKQVADQLSRRGAECALVTRAQTYEVRSGREIAIDPENPTHYQQLLDQVARRGCGPVRGIIHLWALDEHSAQDASGFRAAARLQCGSVLLLLQTLAQNGTDTAPRLVLVTKGAQALPDVPTLHGLGQTPLLGMSKALALEHPEFRCVRLDLDPVDFDADSLAQSIVTELSSPGDEDQVAYRQGRRFVSRLARHSPAAPEADRVDGSALSGNAMCRVASSREPSGIQFRDQATYLITGGVSGLGIRVAHWMASRGARQLALMARSDMNRTSEAQIRELQDRGVTTTFYQGDVSDFGDVVRVLKQISTSSPPLRGIIHSAGILADGSLMQQDWERFERVLKPKVDGAWNLHTLTLGEPLDFFVLFSSAASMLGSPAQANHCAANAFLDAFAAFRHAQGLPALSINWGAWSEIGSAASSNVTDRLATHGLGAMLPNDALRVLAELMTGTSGQVGVIPIDWPSLLRRYPRVSEPPFFSLIAATERARTPAIAMGDTPQVPRDASEAERSKWLRDYLTDRVAAALQLRSAHISPTKPLNQLGLDSLMAIEIRNRLKADLACDVPVVKFLEGTTIAALASQLAQHMNASSSEAGPRNTADDGPVVDFDRPEISSSDITPDMASQLLPRIGALSNDEVDALLARYGGSSSYGQKGREPC